MEGDLQTTAVARTPLSIEVLQRESARSQYEMLRARYEAARLAKERKRLLMLSHTQTRSALQHLLVAMRATLGGGDGGRTDAAVTAAAAVPDVLVATVQLLVSAPRDTNTKDQLEEILQPFVNITEEAMLDGAAQHSSSSVGLCAHTHESANVTLRLGPLLKWSTACVSYSWTLLSARCLQASELARVKCQTAWLTSLRSQASDIGVAPQSRRTALEEARAELKSAKDLQRCVKQRLYATYQRLTAIGREGKEREEGCAHGKRRAPLQPEEAAEMCAQIRKELRRGRVTLLRMLCEERAAPVL